MEDKGKEIAVHATLFSIISNCIMALIKGVAGIIGHSNALIADAIESVTDIFSSLLVFFGIRYANKPADDNHPYGHGRVEPLISIMVGGFLIFSAAIIIYKSILNLNKPPETPAFWTLIVLGLIITWKEFSYQYIKRKSKITNSSSLKADAHHHRSDAITSGAAFIGILISVIFGGKYAYADDWAAMVAGIIILFNSYLILRPAFAEIMDENLYEDLIQHIRDASKEVKGVTGTEKCFVRKSGLEFHVELHAMVNPEITVREGHSISHDLKDKLKHEIPQLGSVTIHIEPDDM